MIYESEDKRNKKIDILNRAIDKAVKNGYKLDMLSQHVQRVYRHSIEVQLLDKMLIIYTKDFAKAFWGEEMIKSDCSRMIQKENHLFELVNVEKPAWQYHLQQMVVAENSILYLEKFL